MTRSRSSKTAEKQVMTRLFNAAWRIAREQVRQQQPTLQVLYNAARSAADAHPGAFPVQLDKFVPEDEATIRQWWDAHLTTFGARDAYASAIVLFVDGTLKAMLRYYGMIPSVPKKFKSGFNGVSTDLIFRYVGNNVRHFDEWAAPTHQIPHRRQAYAAVTAIATVLGRPVPDKKSLSVMATNCAWAVIATISGRTFDKLIALVREFMDELLVTTGLENDPLILSEIAKERSDGKPTHPRQPRRRPVTGRCSTCGLSMTETDAQSLRRRAERLLWLAETIAAQAQRDDDARLALQAVDRARSALETMRRATGLIGGDQQINVTVDARRQVMANLARLDESELRALAHGKPMLDEPIDALLAPPTVVAR